MTATTLLLIANIWGVIGLSVAAVFVLWGVDRIDPNARGAYVFRPMIIPGVVLLWPLVLWRWWTLERGATQWENRHTPTRAAHAWVGVLLALLIPLIFAAAHLVRREWPSDRRPEQIAAPHSAAE